jgi:peptidoglycan biosynthesis protein MviN/MurJ (putative lipid II flippase)
MVNAIFLRGNFNAVSLHQTVIALRMTVFAAIPIALVTVALRALMSQGRSNQVAIVGIVMAVVGIGVLYVAHMLGSLRLAQLHWMIANTSGSLLAWTWLIGSARITCCRTNYILYRCMLSAIVIGLPLLAVSYVFSNTEHLPVIIYLALAGLIYGTVVLLLAIVFRLIECPRLLSFL